MKNKLLVFLLLLSISLPVYAVKWESVIEFSNTEGSAKLFIDKDRVSSKTIKGDKHINFWLRGELDSKVKAETVKSISQYEVNCTTKDIYQQNGDVKFYKKGVMVSQAQSKETKKLQGKEYYDLQDLVKKLCGQY